jgi:hypothetical protein
MRKFVLKSDGKLICGAEKKKVVRAALAMRPPEISPVLRISRRKARCVRKDGIAHAGIVHNSFEGWDRGYLHVV